MLNIQKYTGGFTSTNGYAIETGTGWILVDAPEGITAWLRERAITPTALLLTHMHFDHVMDAAEAVRAFGMPVYAFASPDRDLTLENLLGSFSGSNFDVTPFEIDHLLEGEPSVDAGGTKFHLLHVPGHSPDSLCFHLPGENLLFGGDVLMRGGIGRSDFPHGDGGLLENGIREKIYTLAESTRVLPGHGPETTIGDERSHNPFVRI